MLPPVLLPRAALDAADRLITALVTLAHAVADLADLATPTLADHAIQTLFARLSALVATLIRISHVGLPTPRRPNPATPDRLPPEPADKPDRPGPSLPRHLGWLLAALPDIAPAIADDLGLILADPAFAALLAAAPTLQVRLRPFLRALNLTPTPDAPRPPDPTSPHPPPPPARPTVAAPKSHPPISRPPHQNGSQQAPFYAYIVPFT